MIIILKPEKVIAGLFYTFSHIIKASFLPIIIISAVLSVISCSPRQKSNNTQSDYAENRKYVDSLIFSNRNIDSLTVLIQRFAGAKNICGETVAYRELGKCYREHNYFKEAIDCHRREEELAKKACDTLEIIQALNNIATNYRRLGILDEGASYHYKALAYCEQYGGKERNAILKSKVVSLNGIGNVYLTLNNYDMADSVFHSALDGERILNSPIGQAINYANIGSIKEKIGETDSAWFYYRQSMLFNKEAKSDLGIALCHTHFGELYEKSGNLDNALKEYEAAYDLMKRSSDVWHWLESCIAIARIELKLNNLNTARSYIDYAETTAKRINSLEHLAVIYNLDYQWYKKKNDYKNALDKYVLSNYYSDSLISERSLNQMQNIRIKFERDRRQGEINLIQKSYEAERRSKRALIIVAFIVFLFSISVITFLWFALKMRLKNQQIMRKLEETRTTFFTNVTHEFRTPLTVILGLGHDIENGKPMNEETLRSSGKLIVRQGNILLNLINQLLDISKVKSAIGEPDWHHGDIVTYLDMIIDSYYELAGQKNIEMHFASSQSQIMMDFVPDYIQKIIRNLLSNSIKFTQPFGKIYIIAEKKNDSLVIKVSDNGKGIEQNEIPHIFDAFYQGDNSKGQIGIGVGLALVKQIVLAMNGSIKVTSAPKMGAVFTITLPIKHGTRQWNPLNNTSEISALDLSLDSVKLEDSNDSEESLRNKILIIEDNRDVAYYIGSQLQDKYDIFYSLNGEDGLNKADNLVPDMIITDVMMPGISGYQVCSAVRNSEILNHIPIIIITAKSSEEDKIMGLKAGADAFLIKPFNSDELKVRVEKLLEQRRYLRKKFSENLQNGTIQSSELSQYEQDFLNKFIDIIYSGMGNGQTDIESIADKFCMSSAQFRRKVFAITGENPSAYIMRLRISRAKKLMDSSNDLLIGDIAAKCGFDDIAHFSRVFKQICGMTPSQYRKRPES